MKTELTNMIFIQDSKTGKVVVQKRTKNWVGYTFPGGHVKDGESFVDSAVREALEETGLNVKRLKGCGVIHWVEEKKPFHEALSPKHENSDRYLAFLYKTNDYSGELLPESDEGETCWMSVEEMFAAPSKNGLHEILYMFLHDEYSEAFGSWSGDNWSINAYK